MASSTKTENYQLNQYSANDQPTWVGDYSGDMLKIDTALGNAAKRTGDKFNETETYAVGNLCIKDDLLYKFTAAKEAGAWDETKVKATTIEAEFEQLNGDITQLTEKREWTKVSFIGAVDVTASVPSDKCARVPSTAEEICVEITVKRNASTTIKFSQYLKTPGAYNGGYYNSDKYYASYQIGYSNNIIYLNKSWLKVVDNGTEYNNADTVKVDVYYR
ncbi:hypothetical protein [Hominiventricola filiformis]|uniref:Uncharacterized protein n=1 Tax=Hominiventricola filiformis TaxID=2885352 RepID=A0AAE3A3A7_9FIRM|nr:hypothetical protein [Hominiventricola filiformis]MCC2125266.1 hypothetical protein [Hominiventricola filiformis]